MTGNENSLYFITGNKSKFYEVSRIFKENNLKYKLEQKDLGPIESQAETIRDVAKFKLKNIKDRVKGSFFVEDAGFFVDFPLKGFPGVYSSYVFKTIGNEGILKLIDDFKNSKAHFEAVFALYFKPLDEIFIFKGIVEGKISPITRGNHGFGFDPIFIPNIIPNKTFAELSTEEKNEISHRGIALNKLINFLKEKD
ncbi:MAG: RdgB/HAM1 family non-canonical purine NTP pyrophosphatase [Promethearchaeota archaeon]